MDATAFTMSMPVDTTGRPLKNVPRGLAAALDAFKHAKTLVEMARMFGQDDGMIDQGFDLVAAKLRNAARSTEASKSLGPVFNVGGSPMISSESPAKIDTKGFTDDPDPTADSQLREFRALADFWSWNLKETQHVPDLDDAEGWVGMMRRPGCRWDTLWAAYCVAQVEAM